MDYELVLLRLKNHKSYNSKFFNSFIAALIILTAMDVYLFSRGAPLSYVHLALLGGLYTWKTKYLTMQNKAIEQVEAFMTNSVDEKSDKLV
jgi:hypothetical protein